MPRPASQRHAFIYPLNRLVIRLGMWWQINRAVLPTCATPAEREAVELLIRGKFPLDWAVEERILTAYRFQWHERGRLTGIELVSHPSQRRVPGFVALRRQYFEC